MTHYNQIFHQSLQDFIHHKKIAVIAPASQPNPESLKGGIHKLIQLGFKVNCYIDEKEDNSAPYLSNSKEKRVKNLMQAFEDDSNIIWCARGGFGSAHLLKELESLIIQHPHKILIGFSDVTAMGAVYLKHQKYWIHGPLITTLSLESEESIFNFLNDIENNKITQKEYTIEPLQKQNQPVKGVLTGGNLSLIASLMGTPYELNFKDKILILEETHEAPYRIDRLLTQLEFNIHFKNLRAIVLGHFTDCHTIGSPPQNQLIEALILEKCGPYAIPVVKGLALGHAQPNQALVMGMQAELCFDQKRLKLIGD